MPHPIFNAEVRVVASFPTWLILVAMEIEEQAILSRLPDRRIIAVNSRLGVLVAAATFGAHSIVVARSGVGLVYAGLHTALIACHYPIHVVLSLGVAGSLRPELEIGDLVIAEQVLQHDAICSTPEGEELMAPGQLHVSLPKDQRPPPPFIPDATLRQAICDGLKRQPGRSLYSGTLLSGSEFCADPARKIALARKHPGALAIDMETAGVAQIAQKLALPFLAIKSIADRVNPRSSIAQDYLASQQRAAENAACIVDWLIDSFMGK
ncbi:hypothetical protein [Pendulispora albinea]|uniref:5'-methylthioadenosine/S-adenosylhomocysteine nucleosidase n=1 Tax=Pendulispora albinea TaxID=2741071 RepID=A0ABZ2M5F4_9BACT